MKQNKKTIVLFARQDSIYKQIGCNVYDKDRNALNYAGKEPVIAHPPCRAWGRLKHFAKPEPGEKDLAPWAVEIIRKNGGVLEHPAGSSLWEYCQLGKSKPDQFGGWTLSINQSWFGHRAEKRTYLYIVGCTPAELPEYPLKFDAIQYKIGSGKQEITKAEREHTPEALARWLIELCNICSRRSKVFD